MSDGHSPRPPSFPGGHSTTVVNPVFQSQPPTFLGSLMQPFIFVAHIPGKATTTGPTPATAATMAVVSRVPIPKILLTPWPFTKRRGHDEPFPDLSRILIHGSEA